MLYDDGDDKHQLVIKGVIHHTRVHSIFHIYANRDYPTYTDFFPEKIFPIRRRDLKTNREYMNTLLTFIKILQSYRPKPSHGTIPKGIMDYLTDF